VLALALVGCDRAPEPVMDSREALGTVVAITAYPAEGADEADVRKGLDLAYAEMTRVESALDVHDPTSPIAKINANLAGDLPPEALEIVTAPGALKVDKDFSFALLEVLKLYNFEGEGSVPATGLAEFMATYAREGGWMVTNGYIQLRSDTDAYHIGPGLRDRVMGRVGLDFGGAAKGLALGDALTALETSAPVEAALISAGSTTLTFGEKPDGEPWRIGVEDPRDPDAVIATVEAPGHVAVSTSGDYQRYFEFDGVRYHHILDPRTGEPAHGMRSITVVGNNSGLDSDILSTALFVMGTDKATAYAKEHGLGLVIVDDEGRVRIVPGPANASWEIVETTS